MSFVDRKLKRNEELVTVIKKHWPTFLPAGLLVAVILFLDFFFIFPLFNWGTPGKVIFFIVLVVGLILLLRLIILIKFNIIILTNERIIRIKQKGVFDRIVTEIELDNIREALYRIKGFWQTIFKYGTIMLKVTDSQKAIFLKNIKQPEKTQQLILNVQKMARVNE